MGRKRYLFFDIDGTLAAGGYGETFIPTTTRMALDKAKISASRQHRLSRLTASFWASRRCRATR